MPPALALTLCAIFVFALFRNEKAYSQRGSKALWIPTLWLLFIASRPPGSWMAISTGVDDLSGNYIDQLGFLALYILGACVLVRRRFSSAQLRPLPLLLLLLTYMLISVLWSDIVFVSFKRWTKELGAL